MNAAKSIAANFAIDTHTLFASRPATVRLQRRPISLTYDHGTVVTLTARSPRRAAPFVGWGGDASGSVNPTTVTIDANKVVNATFSIQGGHGPQRPWVPRKRFNSSWRQRSGHAERLLGRCC